MQKNNHKACRCQGPVPQQGGTGPLNNLVCVLFVSSKRSSQTMPSETSYPPFFSTPHQPLSTADEEGRIIASLEFPQERGDTFPSDPIHPRTNAETCHLSSVFPRSLAYHQWPVELESSLKPRKPFEVAIWLYTSESLRYPDS